MQKTIIRANKYRLYPNAKQKALLHELFGLNRFIYNQILSEIKDFGFGKYQKTEKSEIYPRIPNQTELGKTLTTLKDKNVFLYKSGNDYLQGSLANLYKGFKGFYKKGGYPRFKSRKNPKQSINFYAGSRAKFKDDFSPINPNSKIELLRNYSKAYLHHLLKTHEGLGFRLATLNNLEFYLTLMKRIREGIADGSF